MVSLSFVIKNTVDQKSTTYNKKYCQNKLLLAHTAIKHVKLSLTCNMVGVSPEAMRYRGLDSTRSLTSAMLPRSMAILSLVRS